MNMKFIQIIKEVISRGAVGALVGLVVGTISGIIAGLLVGIVINDTSARVIGAVAFMSGIGAPLVGMFVAWSSGLVDHHSEASIEWGITGSVIALLLAWLEGADFAIAVVLMVTYALTAAFAHSTVSVLFGDESRIDRITPRCILLYSSTVLVTTVMTFQVLSLIESLID
jgi:hypothetical protein